jgi:hypothetical protein
MLHGPGIVTGLEIEVSSGGSSPTVIVKPGYAIDPEGRELILGSCVELEIVEKRSFYYVTMEHIEKQTDGMLTEDTSEPTASRIEDGVGVRLAADHEKCISLAIGKIAQVPSGWELDRTFQPLRPR